MLTMCLQWESIVLKICFIYIFLIGGSNLRVFRFFFFYWQLDVTMARLNKTCLTLSHLVRYFWHVVELGKVKPSQHVHPTSGVRFPDQNPKADIKGHLSSIYTSMDQNPGSEATQTQHCVLMP